METITLTRNSFSVEGVQVTEANLEEVAAWCGGEVKWTKDETTKFIKVPVTNPMNYRQTKAFVGDWVTIRGEMFKVYTDQAKERSYHEEESKINNVFDPANATTTAPGPVVNQSDM